MKNLKKGLLALAIVCIVATPVLAKQHGGDGFMGHNGRGGVNVEMLKIALDLTDQQDADIKQIIDGQKERKEVLRDQVRSNREAIDELMNQSVLDESKLQALMQEQSKLHTEMMIERHATKSKIDQLLTQEQREKHEKLREARKEHRGQKRFARQHQPPQ